MTELNEALIHAERTARSVAKTRNKLKDPFWVDEATCEAYFIVTELILTTYVEINEKYPDYGQRFAFYRMSVGWGLKAYFAFRARQTISYLKAKGIITKHESFKDSYIGREDTTAMTTFILEEVTKTPMEKKVLEFYLMGNEWENIAEKVGLNIRRVKKVMRRIKRRLKDVQE